MNHRITLAVAVLVLVASNFLFADDRPNFVFFLADDVSDDDFGFQGHPSLKTPNIDQLAAGGMQFDNAYLTTSSCSPSRCSIITGRYPHNTGAPELHVQLPAAQVRFPELLREAGYYTVLSGKNHMFGNKDRAFDSITKGGGPGGEKDWVDHVKDRPKDKPFFFWFAAFDAHRAWQVSDDAPKYSPDDVVVPPYLVDDENTRSDLASYYHEVSRFDHFVGKVTKELEQQGVLENTMIVVAADNGRPFPRCKTRLYDSGIKTPWVVHYPALLQKPATTDRLISSIDLSATCLELAGVDQPDSIQGKSFVPILKDPTETVREVVFAEHNWHVYKNHERMVRFGDILYIKNNFTNQPNLSYEAHKDGAGTSLWKAHAAGKTTKEQQQIFANPCPAEELFHVGDDPHQLTNLVDNPKYAKQLTLARKLLADWTSQTGDSVPDNPTPHRHAPPKIVDGKVVYEPHKGPRHPEGEMPGAINGASKKNHPGPVRLP